MTTILVIEDDPLVRDSIQDVLEGAGFQILSALDGKTGVVLAREQLPALILCDVQMPGMDGYTVLHTLHQHPTTAHIPFIFLTATGTKTAIREGMVLGADDYLTKPCGASELLAAIASRLEKRATLQAKSQQQLDQLRSSITLSLPHELRTPITGILSGVELLQLIAASPDPDKILEIAANIQISTERLYRLVQNFLFYADLEITAHDPEKLMALRKGVTYDADLIIADVATTLAYRADRANDLHLQLCPAIIAFPEAKLQKLIEELVDNALKFSKANTPIEISSKVDNCLLTIAVINRGRGMTAEQIANLGAYMQFDRKFYEQQGSGLGLVIVKRLLELYGGTLAIDSIPNQTTTLRISIPLSPDDSLG